MVPFWKRRLLIATVPCVAFALIAALACVLMVAAETGRHAIGMSHTPGLIGWRYALGLSVSAVVMPSMALVVLAKPSFRDRLGAGFWIASACLIVQTLLLLAYLVFGAVLTIDLTAGEGRLTQFGVAGLVAAMGTVIVARGTTRVRPRDTAIARLAARIAMLGLALTTVMVPVYIAELTIASTESQGLLGYSLADYHLITAIGSLMLWASLALLTSGVWVNLAARVLADRAAEFHARHCPACGYSLAGIERPECPECGAALADSVDSTQNASTPGSNGNHGISSAPNRSSVR